MRRRQIFAGAAALLGLGYLWASRKPVLDRATFAARYAQPLTPMEPPFSTYHLGHSLVGRDMPAMLAQMTGGSYALQLGWGASLRQHWMGDVPGFAAENATPAHRPAREAIGSGDYAAVILTEMVELKDAIRYHDPARALADWARLARGARPDVRVYLYETWHRWDDPAGWATRVAQDRAALWEDGLLRPAMAQAGVGTIHVIPGGQVMAAVVAAAEAGQVPGVAGRGALFSDQIHLTDLGAFVVALVHLAVLTGRNPLGHPANLKRADGTPAELAGPDGMAALQALVWRVVSADPMTGLG